MKQTIVLFYLSFILFSELHAQQWHRIYFPNKSSVINSVFESNDKGYTLGGNYQPGGTPSNGLIIKTDINGNMLWSKTVSSSGDFTRICDLNSTTDKGYIITGITGEQSLFFNPFIMKLNGCAELEWCRIFNTPNENQEWGQSIWQIPGGYIALFLAYGDDPQNERIWLYRVDNEGDLVWKQVYAQTDSAIYDENSVRMCLTNDYHFVINGFCYYPDPGSPWPQILRPFIIKTDSTGTVEWELPWALINGENYYGESYASVTDNQGTIYSSARHIVHGGPSPGDKPCLIKTDANGNEIGYADFFPTVAIGSTSSINWFADSSIALGAFWTDQVGYDGNVGVVKCTRSGNLIKSKPMFISQHLFADAVTTFDNKLLLAGGFFDGIWRSHAYKLNSELEYDTLYSHPFVYDSVCSHPIPSDTILMDCVVVGLGEQEKSSENTSMVVYPNPASDLIQIRFPEQIMTRQKAISFTISTYHSLWKELKLEIYDLYSRMKINQTIPFDQKQITLRISNWMNGMYIVRLIYNNQVVASTKFIKTHTP